MTGLSSIFGELLKGPGDGERLALGTATCCRKVSEDTSLSQCVPLLLQGDGALAVTRRDGLIIGKLCLLDVWQRVQDVMAVVHSSGAHSVALPVPGMAADDALGSRGSTADATVTAKLARDTVSIRQDVEQMRALFGASASGNRGGGADAEMRRAGKALDELVCRLVDPAGVGAQDGWGQSRKLEGEFSVSSSLQYHGEDRSGGQSARAPPGSLGGVEGMGGGSEGVEPKRGTFRSWFMNSPPSSRSRSLVTTHASGGSGNESSYQTSVGLGRVGRGTEGPGGLRQIAKQHPIASRHGCGQVWLNMSVIVPGLVVMGPPAQGSEGNSLNDSPADLARGLTQVCPQGFLVVNTNVGGVGYDSVWFSRKVVRLPVADHAPPTLRDMRNFIALALSATGGEGNQGGTVRWLVVHDKSGLGRAGVLACAWLLHRGQAASAREAVTTFLRQRTVLDTVEASVFGAADGTQEQLVTGVAADWMTPSMQRFVGLFDRARSEPEAMAAQRARAMWSLSRLQLLAVKQHSGKARGSNGLSRPWFRVLCGGRVSFDMRRSSRGFGAGSWSSRGMTLEPESAECGGMCEEVRVDVFDDETNGGVQVGGDRLLCSFWLHMGFLPLSAQVSACA